MRVMLAFALMAAPAVAQWIAVEPAVLPLAPSVRAELEGAVASDAWPEAEAILFRESQAAPESAALLRALAGAHFQNERHFAAASAYLRADRMEPLDGASRFALATALIALGRGHWARRELERLAAEYPRNPLYPHWLAGVFQRMQWFDEAAAEARRAIALDPGYAAAHDRLGQCLESLGRTDEALAAYELAERLVQAEGAPNAWPSYRRGALLRQAGRFDEAASPLRRAVEFDPDHAEARYELGLVLGKLGDWPAARASLDRAARLAPENAKVHYALAQALRRNGDAAGAAESLRRFRELSASASAP